MGKNVIVINLTRFGDLLQTQALIDDLHKAGHEVGLICLDNFAAALPLLRNVSRAWPFPGSALLAQLDSDWHQALGTITRFAEHIRAEAPPGAVLNLTPTLPARLLTRLLAKADTQTFGFDLDPFGYGLNHGFWASFFSVAATRRANSPFNLSDILRMLARPLTGAQLGSFRLADPARTDWAKEFLAAHTTRFPQAPAGFVAFQLGASQDERRWPVANFRQLGQILWEKVRLAPVLLGSSPEAALGEEYAENAAHPFVNAIGKTDIPELAALLKETRLLVTNDTGTMHLAAGLGIAVLAFFLATAQPWDTGPLLPGSISLEPALDCHPCAFGHACDTGNSCRKRISPATAAFYALKQLGEDPGAMPSAEARAWQTRIGSGNFTELLPLDSHLSSHGAWLTWQRIFWRHLLDGLENPSQADSGSPYSRTRQLPQLPNKDELARMLLQAASIMDSVAECAAGAATSARLGKIFLRNCERLQSHLDTRQPLAALAAFWRELRLNQAVDFQMFGRQVTILAAHVRALASALA